MLFQDDVKDEETGDQKLCTDCKAFFGDIVQQLTGNDTLVGISFYFSDTPIHVSWLHGFSDLITVLKHNDEHRYYNIYNPRALIKFIAI